MEVVNMGSKIGSLGRLYESKNRVTFVSSGTGCPRVNVTTRLAGLRDDYSNGIKTNKSILKLIFK